jgi:nicotinamide-nucleotide amidase
LTLPLEEEIGNLLLKNSLTLGVVESATGGLISHRITNVSGSSDYYKGSVTSYSNEIKTEVVGVKEETITRYGAVSSQVAEEMAEGGRKLLNVDICLSDTGIAGPTGATSEKPVGLFYIGLSSEKGVQTQRHIFQGNREENKRSAAGAALKILREYLLGLDMLEEKHVVTCFLESEGEILIVRRSEKVGAYQGRWTGVSGYMEKGAGEQALTEIAEESGLSAAEIELIRKGDPLEVIDEKIKRKWIVHPFIFHIADRNKVRIDWEHKEMKWIDPEEIEQYETVPMLKETLERVCKT